jgi:hypothetical protein
MSYLLELILICDVPAVVTFAVGFLLWHLGIREPFTLTFLSLVFGALPVYLLETRTSRSARFTASGNRRKAGRPEENTHPGAR